MLKLARMLSILVPEFGQAFEGNFKHDRNPMLLAGSHNESSDRLALRRIR